MPKEKLKDDLELEIDSGGILTMKELREFIKEQKLNPSDLFDDYSLQEDDEIKKLIAERAEFELEFRDQESEREMKKMDKENKNESNDFDLLPEGSVPSSEPQQKKKPDEKQKPLEIDEPDLLPGGDSEPSESNSGNQENEDSLLPS